MLLTEAIRLPEDQRTVYLEREAGDDRELLEEANQLLDIHARSGQFMSQPLPEMLAAKKTAETLTPGTILRERYRIVRHLSVGGFATVYQAADELLEDKQVVIKVIDQPGDDETFQAVFKAEVFALSRVNHPNVVGITDVGTTNQGRPFVVLHFVPGKNLREVMAQGKIEAARARRILKETANALSAAHRADILHLDLKPENVIVTNPGERDERVTLIDFGIARLKEASVHTLAAATPDYRAPEQFTSPSHRTDVYLFALLAFELFAGELPRSGVPVESQLDPNLGMETIRAIAAGLRHSPAERPNSIDEFIGPIGDLPHGTFLKRKRWMVPVALSVAAVIAGYFYYQASNSSLNAHYSESTPLIVSLEDEHRPTFSPDGNLIYYQAGEPGRTNIYRKEVSGGDPVLVVRGHVPIISPNGKTLVFARTVDGVSQIMRKTLPNGPVTVLADGDIDGGSFSPDGDQLLIAHAEAPGGVSVKRLILSSNRLETVHVPRNSECPLKHLRISPDGRKLAFACTWMQGFDDLFVSNLGANLEPSSVAQRLSYARDRINSLDWAPDSSSILFVAGPLGNGVIKRAYLTGAEEPKPVPIRAERVGSLAIPRFAFKIAYSKYLSDTNVWALPLGSKASPKRLVATTYEDELPRFSPDGRKVAVNSIRGGNLEVWLYDAGGANGKRLFVFPESETGGCIWVPPGNDDLVCSAAHEKRGHRIFRSQVSSGRLTPILDGFSIIECSRDGKWLYAIEHDEKLRNIFRFSYPSMEQKELVAEGGAFGTESYDGQWFYFAMPNAAQGVWKMRLPHGKPFQVVSRTRRRDTFVSGTRGVYYIGPRADSKVMELYFLPYDSGVSTRLHTFDHDIGWGVSLSPDERTLVYTQIDSSNSDIMLVSNFR